jgi:excisionase family DNA binding protein
MQQQSAWHVPSTARYLLPSEAAEVFSVSPKTITRWAREGRLPYQRTLGGHRRYDPQVIANLGATLRQEVAA